MVSLNDLKRLLKSYNRWVNPQGSLKKKSQLLIEAIYNQYREAVLEGHVPKENALAHDPFHISRDDLIWEVWRKKLTGKSSDKKTIHSFADLKTTLI